MAIPSGRRWTRRDRDIAWLALPAFAALVAEPLFLLADAAVVGTLGTAPLAGLGAAGAVISTLVGLCIFLAYGTTATVARQLGAGRPAAGLHVGVDALWLAGLLGLAVFVVAQLAAESILSGLGARGEVLAQAEIYLRIGLLGVPPMLLSLAAVGVLRGQQNTLTPAVVTAVAAVVNLALDLWWVLGLGLGIAGSAWATVVAQVGTAVTFVALVARAARRAGATLSPDLAGVSASARVGGHLFVRTVALRAVLVVAVVIATRAGPADLAAYHVSLQIWLLLALAMDALAIAGQALVGHRLGAGDTVGARADLRRLLQWGTAGGVVLGLLVAGASPWLPRLFTADPAVASLLTASLLVVAVHQPVAGPTFVLDGVLIGAGDARWLAGASVVVLVAFVPLGVAVVAVQGGVVGVWWALLGFLLTRLALLAHRARSDAWLVPGSGEPGTSHVSVRR